VQSETVSIVSVIVSPVAALMGSWVNSRLAQRQRRRDQQDTYRDNALQGLASFMSLVLDANPSLVLRGDLREYPTASAAIKGLYARWKKAREPLVLLAFSHPSDQVRTLAFQLQAGLEMVLRSTDDVLRSESPPSDSLQEDYDECVNEGAELGRLVEASNDGRTSVGSRAWLKHRSWRLGRRRHPPAEAHVPPRRRIDLVMQTSMRRRLIDSDRPPRIK
jgi:hypothetical protein